MARVLILSLLAKSWIDLHDNLVWLKLDVNVDWDIEPNRGILLWT